MCRTTVVIVNYNGLAYIKNCIESVLKSDSEVKIIVVDNGSKDGSVDVIKSSFPEVKLIELGENTGFCHATNVGVLSADTEYVMFLNDDTVIERNAISTLESDMDKCPKAFAIQAKMVKMSDSNVIDSAGDLYCALGWAFAIGKDKKASNYVGFKRVFSACGGASLYRRNIIEKIGALDENHFAYLEDVDICYRALIYGYSSYIENGALVHHVGSGTTGSRHNEFKVSLSSRNSIYLIYKNMPFLQILINFPFLLTGFLIKTLFFARKGLGKTYIKGLKEGFLMCKIDGKKHKVPFAFSRLSRYIYIEVQLLWNIVRRFAG